MNTIGEPWVALGIVLSSFGRHHNHSAPRFFFLHVEKLLLFKKIMFTNSNVIVTLPGGAGSLDEFFEILTWTQLGINKKPVYLLNIDSYWDPLIHLIEHMIKQDFADSDLLGKFQVMDSVADLETSLQALH